MPKKTFKQFFEGCGLRHSEEEETTDLGYANSWGGNPPAEYTAHKENCCERVFPRPDRPDYSFLKCPEVTNKIGSNLEEVTCKKCGIKWKVDSSG